MTDWSQYSTNPRKRTHKDVEFHVEEANARERALRTFDTWDEAAAFAVGRSGSTGRTYDLDVVIYSEAGARWWGGDDGVELYREDPEASVFYRSKIKVNDVGRVP